MILFARQEWDADIENRQADMKRGEGSEMNWEIGIDIYTLLCVKPIASGKLLHNKESLARHSVVAYSCRMGVEVGRRSKKEGIDVYV